MAAAGGSGELPYNGAVMTEQRTIFDSFTGRLLVAVVSFVVSGAIAWLLMAVFWSRRTRASRL